MSDPTKVAWTDPTTNTDGSPVTPGEITGYVVGVRVVTDAAGVYPFSIQAPGEAANEAMLDALSGVLPKGQDLVAAVKAVTATGESAWSSESNTFQFAVPVPTPNPPTNPSVS